MDFNQAIETAKKRFTVAQWVVGIGGGLLMPMVATQSGQRCNRALPLSGRCMTCPPQHL
jgi:hypothetical protein